MNLATWTPKVTKTHTLPLPTTLRYTPTTHTALYSEAAHTHVHTICTPTPHTFTHTAPFYLYTYPFAFFHTRAHWFTPLVFSGHNLFTIPVFSAGSGTMNGEGVGAPLCCASLPQAALGDFRAGRPSRRGGDEPGRDRQGEPLACLRLGYD